MNVEELHETVNAHVAGGEIDEARGVVDAAIAEEPGNPELFNLRGGVEMSAHRYEAALGWFQKAVALAPETLDYRMNVAVQLIVGGKFDAAREELERVLAIDPKFPAAYAHLAFITKTKPGDGIIDVLERLKRDAGAPEHFVVQYSATLGKCYDDIGEYDLAFANYKAARDPLSGRYDVKAQTANFESIKKIWSAQFINERKAMGFASRKPVFIVGMPRSGTTLLAQKLSGRPDVADLGERTEIGLIARAIERNHPNKVGYPWFAPDVQPQAWREFGQWYVETLAENAPYAQRYLDKNNMSFLFVGLIQTILPDALIVDSKRDPVSTCLSCYFAEIASHQDWAFSLASIGHFYRLYDDLMRHWEQAAPRFRRVRHEDVIDDPEGVAAELHGAMGLPASAPQDARKGAEKIEIRTLSAVQARQPINKKLGERWRNYERHLGPLFDALGDLAH